MPLRSPFENNHSKVLHILNHSLLFKFPTETAALVQVQLSAHSITAIFFVISYAVMNFFMKIKPIPFIEGCDRLTDGIFLIRSCFLTPLCLCTCCFLGINAFSPSVPG